jgi:hypothetical protein
MLRMNHILTMPQRFFINPSGWWCLLLFFLFSCKDAPVVTQAAYCNVGQNGIYLMSQQVFTVTSSKSKGGSTTRSGYTTQYLLSIDPATGKTINRLKIGDGRARVEYLGTAAGKAWFFGYDSLLGIHSRNPATLDVIDNTAQIIARNPALKAGITEQAHQHAMDTSGQYLILTTKEGYTYRMDPSTLLVTPAESPMRRNTFGLTHKSYGGSYHINDSLEINFMGNPRRVLELTRKRKDDDCLQFFFGKKPKEAITRADRNMCYKTVDNRKFSALSFIDPEYMIDQHGDPQGDDRIALLRNGNTIFILSKSIIGVQYNWIITALALSYTDLPQQLWQYEVQGGEKLSSSAKDFVSADFTGKTLLLAFAHTYLALDGSNGRLVWQERLREKE